MTARGKSPRRISWPPFPSSPGEKVAESHFQQIRLPPRVSTAALARNRHRARAISEATRASLSECEQRLRTSRGRRRGLESASFLTNLRNVIFEIRERSLGTNNRAIVFTSYLDFTSPCRQQPQIRDEKRKKKKRFRLSRAPFDRDNRRFALTTAAHSAETQAIREKSYRARQGIRQQWPLSSREIIIIMINNLPIVDVLRVKRTSLALSLSLYHVYSIVQKFWVAAGFQTTKIEIFKTRFARFALGKILELSE